MSNQSDYELGEPVAAQRNPDGSSVVISLRLSRAEAERLQACARREDRTLSRTARRAIVAYCDGTGPVLLASAVTVGSEPLYVKWHQPVGA